jgi:hypothetical protein
MHGDLAGARAEHETLHANKVAEVEVLLEEVIVHRLVLAGRDVVTTDVDLLVSFAIAQHGKRRLAHDADAHNTACNADVLLRCVVLEAGRNGLAGRVNGEFRCGERFDAEVADLLQRSAAVGFLFAQCFCHFLEMAAKIPAQAWYSVRATGIAYSITTRRLPSREMPNTVPGPAGRPNTSNIGAGCPAGFPLTVVIPVEKSGSQGARYYAHCIQYPFASIAAVSLKLQLKAAGTCTLRYFHAAHVGEHQVIEVSGYGSLVHHGSIFGQVTFQGDAQPSWSLVDGLVPDDDGVQSHGSP